MLTRMNRGAFDALMRELNKEGTLKFVNYTHNRLKNEDPIYAFLAGHFADQCAKDLGPRGFENARQISAICYRACELAQEYNSRMQYQNIPEDPPPTQAAIEETEMLLSLVKLRSGKNPE